MGCKVNGVFVTDGEGFVSQSRLFQDLVKSMPLGAALETYLSIKSNEDKNKVLYGQNSQGEVDSSNYLETAKYKLDEFDTYQEQVDTMDYLVDGLVTTLKSMAGVHSPITIAGINLDSVVNDPSVISIAINDTRVRLISEAMDLRIKGVITKDQENLRRKAALNLNKYLQYETADGPQLGPLAYKLRDHGIQLSFRDRSPVQEELDQDEEVGNDIDEEAQSLVKERIYDMDILENSASGTILESVRIFLRGLKRVDTTQKIKDINDIKYEVSSLGQPEPLRYEQVVGRMFAVLEGVQSPGEMIKRLESSVKSSPELYPILKALIEEGESNVTVKLDGKDTVYKPIATALYTTFAKKNYNMFTIAEDKGEVMFFKSNASSVENKMITRWAPSILSARKSPEIRNALLRKYEELTKGKVLASNLNSNNPSMIVYNEVAKLFVSAGFNNVTGLDLLNLTAFVKENKLRFSKDLDTSKPSNIIDFFLKTLVKNVADDKDIFAPDKTNKSGQKTTETNKEMYGENRNIRALSKVVSARITDISMNAYYSNGGYMVHPINLGSEGQEVWDRLVLAEERELFNEDPIYSGNSILAALDNPDHLSMFDVAYMDVLNDNSKSGAGVKYGSLSTFDALASKLNGFFVGHAKPEYYYSFSPTQGDRGKLQALILPKIGLKNGVVDSVYLGGNLNNEEITEWIRAQVLSEVDRMVASKSDKYKYANYSGKNALKFNLFTALNEQMSVEGLTDANKYKYVDQAMSLIDGPGGILRGILDTDIETIVSNDLLERDGDNFKVTKAAKGILGSKVGRRGILTKTQLDNFLVNNFIHTYDQTTLYMGDLAYYKASSEFDQKADLNKRFSLPFTPGIKPAVGREYGLEETAKVKVLNEPEIDSELAEFYNTLTGSKTYNKIELADGAGFVSLKRYRSLMMSLGMHNDEMLAYIDAELAWKPGDAPITKQYPLDVLKAFYYKLQKGVHGRVAPMNLKYSIMPVIPSYFESLDKGSEKFPSMAKISRELRSGRADEIVMSSAVKVGRVNLTSLENLENVDHTTIHNNSVRFPQVSAYKEKNEDRFGSQMRKIITNNFDKAATMTFQNEVGGDITMSGSEALTKYEEALKTLVSLRGDTVYKQFVKNNKVDEAKLIAKLLKDIDTNPYNNADYYKQALTTLGEDGERLMSINYPTVRYKIDSMINAAFRNKVNRLELPGHSAVQVTSFGTASKKDIDISSDLSFVRLDGVSKERSIELAKAYKLGDKTALEGVKILPAEIRITPKFFKSTLKKEAARRVDKGIIKRATEKFMEDTKELQEMWSEDEKIKAEQSFKANVTKQAVARKLKELEAYLKTNGQFDINKIREAGLDETVMYRIPTQGKNSMAPGRIIGFLPESMGGSIQIPAEMVAQSGSDFDIDKLFIEMSAFNVTDEGIRKLTFTDSIKTEDEAKAYIKEFHRSVLTSPEYLADLLSPNGSPTLVELSKILGTTDEAATANFASLSTQEMFRANNKSGKELIAISSVASVAHSVSQHIKPKFVKQRVIAGEPVIFGREYTIQSEKFRDGLEVEDGQLKDRTAVKISREIEEIQTASLDNAKDPLLGKLNINDFTANVVLVLVSAGYGLEFATAIVNAPIVKALSDAYPRFARKYPPASAYTQAKKYVLRKYGIKRLNAETKAIYVPGRYGLVEATAALQNPESIPHAAAALKAFEDIRELGNIYQDYQTAMNFDSKGTASTTAGLLKQYTRLAAIKGTLTHDREFKNNLVQEQNATPVEDIKYKSASHLSAAFMLESSKVKLKEDGSAYEITNSNGNVTTLQRMTSYLSQGNDRVYDKKKSEAATKAGSYIDTQVRNFFITGEIDDSNMHPKAAKVLLEKLEALKAKFKASGETPMTSNDYLKVYDEKLGVAGEMDLLTIDKSGKVRIYDTKTERYSTPAEYKKAYPNWTKEQAETVVSERNTKHGKQLNGYRGVLRNMIGVSAIELNIFPLGISYNETGSYIDTVRDTKELLRSHPIVEDLIPDTRNLSSASDEKVIQALGLNVAQPDMEITDYGSSHLSRMEKKTIHDPLKVNRMVTASASAQMQNVLKEAINTFGWLSDSQQNNLFFEYDTYLAQSKGSHTKYFSAIADDMEKGLHLDMTNKNSPKCVANLLTAYRNYVSKNKQFGVKENKFLEALTVIHKDGRDFIGLDSTFAKGLSGETKKEMMFYFEDLMRAPEGSLEYTLARDLTKYAIMYYGFSRTPNSYMEFIPPSAHDKFTKGEGSTLPKFFKEVYSDLDDTKSFSGVDKFLLAYAQNNYHKLPLMKINPMQDEDGVMWQERLFEEYESDKKGPPKFVLVKDNSEQGESLYTLTGNTYSMTQFRGVKGLAVEYFGETSQFSTPLSRPSNDAVKATTSKENSVVMGNFESRMYNMAKFFEAVGDYTKLASPEEFTAYLDRVSTEFAKTEFTPAEIKGVMDTLQNVNNDALSAYKAGIKRGRDVVYSEIVNEKFNNSIMDIAYQQPNIALKIKYCS